jgi:hypothetical protein
VIESAGAAVFLDAITAQAREAHGPTVSPFTRDAGGGGAVQ